MDNQLQLFVHDPGHGLVFNVDYGMWRTCPKPYKWFSSEDEVKDFFNTQEKTDLNDTVYTIGIKQL